MESENMKEDINKTINEEPNGVPMDDPNGAPVEEPKESGENKKKEEKDKTIRRTIIIIVIVLLILLLLLLLKSCNGGKRKNDPSDIGDKGTGTPTPTLTPTPGLADLKPGDIFLYGVYEQDNDLSNGKEPIEWVVLSNENGELFATTKYLIEGMPYNEEYVKATWETCTLREWLNGDFLNESFNDEERNRIKTKYLVNGDNQRNGLDGGNDTIDRIFILSYDDVVNPAYGFSSDYNDYDIKRRCASTAYAAERAESQHSGDPSDFSINEDGLPGSIWWIRMPGTLYTEIGGVNGIGNVNLMGFPNKDRLGVRPAMCLHLYGEYQPLEPTPVTNQRPVPDFSVLKKGDVFAFGAYEQDNDLYNDKEPVDWIVLDIDNGELLALARYPLDAHIYHENFTEVTWADSTLRAWMNNEFMHELFTEDEINILVNKDLKNKDNPMYGSSGGIDTQDKVFLLSLDDVLNPKYGFSSDPKDRDDNRSCTATKYANTSARRAAELTDPWLLRSPGMDGLTAAFVYNSGEVAVEGGIVCYFSAYLRPAIWVKVDQ